MGMTQYKNNLFEEGNEGGDAEGAALTSVEVTETEVWAVCNALAGGAARDAALKAANITGVKVSFVLICSFSLSFSTPTLSLALTNNLIALFESFAKVGTRGW